MTTDYVRSLISSFMYASSISVRGNKITLEARDITFELLSKLSELFGTKDINIESEYYPGGGCSTCDGSYSYNDIVISDYKIDADKVKEFMLKEIESRVKRLVEEDDYYSCSTEPSEFYSIEDVQKLFPEYEVNTEKNRIVVSWKKQYDEKQEQRDREYEEYLNKRPRN